VAPSLDGEGATAMIGDVVAISEGPSTEDLTLDDIFAELRDAVGVPRVCLEHADQVCTSVFWRRGRPQVAQFTCGCRLYVPTMTLTR
jgi:hypothetical protein